MTTLQTQPQTKVSRMESQQTTKRRQQATRQFMGTDEGPEIGACWGRSSWEGIFARSVIHLHELGIESILSQGPYSSESARLLSCGRCSRNGCDLPQRGVEDSFGEVLVRYNEAKCEHAVMPLSHRHPCRIMLHPVYVGGRLPPKQVGYPL